MKSLILLPPCPLKKESACLDDEVENYSRMDCLTKNVFQEAWKACHCTPWTMGELINDYGGYCNVTGACNLLQGFY